MGTTSSRICRLGASGCMLPPAGGGQWTPEILSLPPVNSYGGGRCWHGSSKVWSRRSPAAGPASVWPRSGCWPLGGPGGAPRAGAPRPRAEPVEGAERPLALVADVTDEASVGDAVAAVAERWVGLDVLVTHAGIGAQGTVEDNPLEEWRRVLDVNLLGMVRTARVALPHLRRSATAAIVNTCSIAATAGLPERALYSASK